MCGIVGAVSPRNVVPVLIDGIRRLEYRGYDSSGLAIIGGGDAAQLERLVSAPRAWPTSRRRPRRRTSTAHTGISHTRWATHGAPTPVNAHPHVSGGEIAVVHNGIIENYEALRERLKAQGYVFATQTDTEVIAHLVHAHWHGAGGGDLLRAVQAAVAEFHGAYAIAVISTREPGRVVGARAGQPAGRRHRRRTTTSSRPTPRRCCRSRAASSISRKATSPTCAASPTRSTTRAASASSARSSPSRRRATRSSSARTATSCRRRSSSSRARSPTRSKASAAIDARPVRRRRASAILAQVDSVLVLACGTSYYSGLVAKQWIESLARHPVPGRDRQRIPLPRQRAQPERAGRRRLAVGRDRRHAGRAEARAGARPRAHARDLQRRRRARWCARRALTYLTRAGAEIGVASTKAFTTQLVAHFLLALTLAKLRGRLTAERGGALAARPAAPAGGAAGGARARAAADRVGAGSSRRSSTRCSSAAACTTRSRSKAR